MSISRRQAHAWLAGAISAPLLSSIAAAQGNWPTQAVHLIVGFPAGSSPDLTARALAEPLEKALGQTVIVENKVGAGGNIAAQALAQASDGHTLSVMINGNMTIAKLLNPAVRYDPLKDLAPVSLIGVAPLVLVTAPNMPSGRAFFDAARNSGSKWNYGSPGVGTVGHLGMELLKSRAKITPQHVPYAGYPQVFNALVAGDLHLSMLPPALAQAQIAAGKLQGIGVSSAARSALVPGLPSLTELGIAGMDLEIWNGVAAPAAMPAAHIARLAQLVSTIVRTPEMRRKLALQGWQAVGSSPEGLRNRIQADVAALGGIIRQQGIKVQ